tara:strand:- start:5745 stop:6995 length:1251 start_codon:yes stop_codon:yes gene_type:complete
MKTFNVKDISENISNKNKNSFLGNFFKKNVLKKFSQLENGYIKIIDGKDIFEVGDKKNNLKCEINIKSIDFYVFLGSGGLLGSTEAYAAGLWACTDLVALTQIMVRNQKLMSNLDSGIAKLIVPINKLIHYTKRNTVLGSKKNILAHYDLGNDFYQLWLDQTMTYSCGYFENKETSLKDASIKKLDMICKKLKLNDKDSVLEIGTGWGSFAVHAAKNYGCKITTTTISDEQYSYAKNLIEELNLSHLITLIKKDYRHLQGKYDKIASIEMIEAVGHKNVPAFFSKVSSLLKDGGLFAMQGITYNDQKFDLYKNSVDFINKYIFPGSCLISIAQVSEIVKTKTNFDFVDLEDITKHYATTLNIWRENFLKQSKEVKELGFSEAFIRLWEFYFTYCEAGFLEKNIGDYQFLFSKQQEY